jgi:transcriptional regulator with XRE-family HTH domain
VKADGRITSDRLARRFGRNLHRLRGQEGLSQESLGHRAGLHRTAIGMIETGQRTPRVDTLVKLAVALDRDPAELLRGLADELLVGCPERSSVSGDFAPDQQGPVARIPATVPPAS